MTTLLCILVLIILAISLWGGISNYRQTRGAEQKIENEEKSKRKENLEHQKKYMEVISTLGKPDLNFTSYSNAFSVDPNHLKEGELYLSIFKKERKIWIVNGLYRFEDISSITVTIQRYISRKKEYTEHLDSGKVIKRAAIGGLLLGLTGAAIGAATTSKNKILNFVDGSTEIIYRLLIQTNTSKNSICFLKGQEKDLDIWLNELKNMSGIHPKSLLLEDICVED